MPEEGKFLSVSWAAGTSKVWFRRDEWAVDNESARPSRFRRAHCRPCKIAQPEFSLAREWAGMIHGHVQVHHSADLSIAALRPLRLAKPDQRMTANSESVLMVPMTTKTMSDTGMQARVAAPSRFVCPMGPNLFVRRDLTSRLLPKAVVLFIMFAVARYAWID